MQHMEEMKHEPLQSSACSEVTTSSPSVVLAVKQVHDRSQQTGQSIPAIHDIAIPAIETTRLSDESPAVATPNDAMNMVPEGVDKSVSTSEKVRPS